VRLKAVSLESDLSKPEALSAFTVGDDLSETLFDKDLQGRSVTVGHLSRFLEKTVRNLYGCFHKYLYIIVYGNMSNGRYAMLVDQTPLKRRPTGGKFLGGLLF
jgi:hypothetical protein